jgi:hypothetical protein
MKRGLGGGGGLGGPQEDKEVGCTKFGSNYYIPWYAIAQLPQTRASS